MSNATAQSGAKVMQGIEVPAAQINQGGFFTLTRRKRTPEGAKVYAGAGNTDNFELRKSDIIAGIHIRFSGTLTTTHSAGAVVPTYRWPYDFIRAIRFTANGQSNLINVSGAKLKAREHMARLDHDDRGVSRQVGGAAVTQGTMSLASENWGLAPGQSQATATTVPVELTWYVPVASDDKDLTGAIFAQTSAMDLTVSIDWDQLTNLFTVSGGDTVAVAGSVIIETEKYSIPVVDGSFILPDLSLFHSLVQTRQVGLQQGDNELRLIGQGAGKALLRLFYQVWAGATPAPIAATAANYGPQGWRYGSNETPELFQDGMSLRQWNERCYNSDLGSVWGFLSHEFEVINAFRDSVDMGQTSELRLLVNLAAAQTAPAIEYVQETVFSAGTAS